MFSLSIVKRYCFIFSSHYSDEDLVVKSDDDCEKLLETGWKTITVNVGLCNSMKTDLTIRDYPYLREIVVKKNSLLYLNSLTITKNSQLTKIETDTCFKNVKTVVISGIVISN